MSADDDLALFSSETGSRPLPTFPSATQETDMPTATGYPRGRTERGRAAPALARCRSCRAPMLWVTFPSGKRNPLDADPTPTGNIIVVERPGRGGVPWRVAMVINNDALLEEAHAIGLPLYTTHFKTCPDADEHRNEVTRAARRGAPK